MNLTLVRHGETDWNRDQRIQGSTDIPLNDTGRAQARDCARTLAERTSAGGMRHFASSDLSRAAETCDILMTELALRDARPPYRHAGLRERNYGSAEGMTAEDLARNFGGASHTAAVPDAEPWAEVRQRTLGALADVVAHARAAGATDADELVVVAHGGVIRELIQYASDGALPRHGERLANASAHSFFWREDRLEVLAYAAVPV